jgi:hypothetical protein
MKKEINNNFIDPEEIKNLKKSNNHAMWINAFLPIIIFAIVLRIITDEVSFIGGIGIGLLLSLAYEFLKLISSSISYYMLGGKDTQVKNFYIILKASNFPLPNKYTINDPEGWYNELIESDDNIDKKIIIASTIFTTGITLARSQGAFVRVMRLRKAHTIALSQYREFLKNNMKDMSGFIFCSKCNELIEEDSNYCIYCSNEIDK